MDRGGTEDKKTTKEVVILTDLQKLVQRDCKSELKH